MTNYKEIIRLHSLGLNKTRIAESCGCARSTVITALHKAEENGLSWNAVKNLSSEEVARKLYPVPHLWGSSTVCRTTSGSTRKCRRAASRSACCGWSIANGAAKTVSSPISPRSSTSTTPTMFTKRKRPCTWSTSPVRTSRWTGPVRPLGLRTRTPASACPPISL